MTKIFHYVRKIPSITLIVFISLIGIAEVSFGDCLGCCSSHGGVCCVDGVTKCCDGTSLSDTCSEKGCNACSDDSSSDDEYSTYEETTIRLYGIDCPETDQDYGQEATIYTTEKVLEKTVEILPIDTDQYGRTVGIVNIDNTDNIDGSCLNEDLLENGLAWVYDDYCKRSECIEWKNIESDARSNYRGLWASNNPIPPWEWRQQTVLIYNQSKTALSLEESWRGTVTEIIDGDTIIVGQEEYSYTTEEPESDGDVGCFLNSMIKFLLICPISSLGSKFNPRNGY